MKKIILILLCIGMLFYLGRRLYDGYTDEPSQMMKRRVRPVAVQVEPVKTMTIRDIHTFTGSLRADSLFMVAPKVGGRLEQVTVHLGEPVRRGLMVARIEAAEYRQQVEEARAELEVAKARISQCRTKLNLAEMEFARVEKLTAKKIASEAEFDQVQSELKTVEAELMVLKAQAEQREAALKGAKIRLGYTEIQAMWENGSDLRYVGERFVDEGQMLVANTPIFSIVDIETLKAVINVIERDYPYLKKDQEAVIITDAFPGETFSGAVRRVSNVLKESTRQAEVEIRVPNKDLRLKPGMFVRVCIEFARKENATVVPKSAIVGHQGKTGVYLLSDDEKTVSFIPVESGIEEGGMVEVESPALSGRVVVIGHQLLKDGASVILPVTDPENPVRPEE